MEKTQKSKASQSIRFLIVTFFISIILLVFLSEDMVRVTDVVRKSGLIGLVVSVGVYGVMGATVIPTDPLTVLLAAIYGPLPAMITASCGNLLAAIFEYIIGTKIGDATSFAEKKDKLPFGLSKFPIESPVLLIFGRMIPGYGSKLISLLAGVYRVRLWRYTWATAISTIAGAAMTAYAGFGVLQWARSFHLH